MINHLSRKLHSGFTIVELLIVIVVIAILAAISIVAYNGIQTRGENAKTISAVGQYAKAMSLYATENNVYPGKNYPCLADKDNKCGRVSTDALIV